MIKPSREVARGFFAEALLRAIEGISERDWCATWYSEIEYILWSELELGEFQHGGPYLRVLADEAGGWWTWRDPVDDGGMLFVELAKWEEHWREYLQSGSTWMAQHFREKHGVSA